MFKGLIREKYDNRGDPEEQFNGMVRVFAWACFKTASLKIFLIKWIQEKWLRRLYKLI